MSSSRPRLDRARAASTALACAFALAGCDESSPTNRRYIPLTRPVAITWTTSGAVVSAAAALRVDWTVRIENVPADTTVITARHVSSYDDQEMIAFSWDRHNNVGLVDFAPGDSCVVRVSYPQLDPAEPGARASFRLP
jgi:hypothetical protein